MALLFTGYSVREICRKLSINPKTFYDHVDHIASRCRRKLATIDARWVNHANHYELASNYIALQPKSNNGVYWIVSGEAHSGYILCQHVNYASDEEPIGTLDHNPYDQVSRFVSQEFTAEASEPPAEPSNKLRERIDQKYQTILARANVEDPLGNLSVFHYPSKGALIRPPYTSYAHYLHVLDMCGSNKHVAIYMPQDPLLRSAALSVCLSRIKNKSVDLMYVEEDPAWDMSLPFGKIDIVYMSWWRDRWAISNQGTISNQGDRSSNQGDRSKGICYLAGDNNEPEKWFNVATTRQVQFYQNRFQLLFEGFINEPRRKLRPGGILPLLDIFRAWHNLCYQDKQGLTAAQRLEVTDAPLTIKQLLS